MFVIHVILGAKCIFPFKLVMHSNISTVFQCDFLSVHVIEEKWTENMTIQPPFLLLDSGFTIVSDLMSIYNLNYDCISLWNPFGFESMATDHDAWIQTSMFPWSGALFIKETSYDACIYPEVSRVHYSSSFLSEIQLEHFQTIGKSINVRLPEDSTKYATSKKTGKAKILRSMPNDFRILENPPTAQVVRSLKYVEITNYSNIGLVCSDCTNTFMVRQFLKTLNIPISSHKHTVPSKQDFMENYFIEGFLRIPYGLYTLFVIPESTDQTSVAVSKSNYKYDLIQPKTSCADYCVFKNKICDIKIIALINNCKSMYEIFSCKYCYSGNRLIYYFKTGICETAKLDKLSCYSSGFGTIPCICS
eukprot:NODE_388_length_9508_cov_0.225954.p3 type:complete len:361 gc:universal NODE_388_length_9508_cov_0.225954:1382-2464(+)